MAKKLPKEILIYAEGVDDEGEPYYFVARNISELPEEADGTKVGVYVLNYTSELVIERVLK